MLASAITWIDWAVIAGFLAFTTWIGAHFSGKQATIRDFFLGGRKLAWWAVAGSIIATELSAVSFVGIPAMLFAAGGDLKYLQLVLGLVLARFVIAWVFVPRYYEREIYSPYEYMGARLGPQVHRLTSAFFVIGAVLGQGVRVYTTALVLEVVAGFEIATSIWVIGAFAVFWTLLGGITTVIWTDVVQFAVMVFGLLAILLFVAWDVGFGNLFSASAAAGKLTLFDLSTDPNATYTLWTGLFGATFLTLASHGTDQMMAQRLFCCGSKREAQKALIWSSFSQLFTVGLMVVGAALVAWFAQHPLSTEQAALYARDRNNILPIFVVDALPTGLSGLIVASLFAAAISSLDSVLSALSQTTINLVYRPLRPQASEATVLRASRAAIVVWGVVLCGMALVCIELAKVHANLIDLALSMPSYTYGALLGTFLLALLPSGANDRGVIFASLLSMLAIFATRWHGIVPAVVVLVVGAAALIGAGQSFAREPLKLAFLCVALFALAEIAALGGAEGYGISFAWPWAFPLGTALTVVLGWLLSARRGEPQRAEAA
ncbi:MAG: sodium/solute symporter [Planctomycetes bacterium]|nr:sodium/solute symporter [Planctomycetota bacterium]